MAYLTIQSKLFVHDFGQFLEKSLAVGVGGVRCLELIPKQTYFLAVFP